MLLKYSSAILLSLALGCTAPSIAPRDLAGDHIDSLLDLENRVGAAKHNSTVLSSIGLMDQDDVADYKEHLDLFYLYYWTANVKLAEGEIDLFEEAVEIAEEELTEMEGLIEEAASHVQVAPVPEVRGNAL